MKFIEKNIQKLFAIPFALLLAVAAVLYFEVPVPFVAKAASKSGQTFTCPMHPEVVRTQPGSCPTCRMNLAHASPARSNHAQCSHAEGQGQDGQCAHEAAAGDSCCPKGDLNTSATVPEGSGCTRVLPSEVASRN